MTATKRRKTPPVQPEASESQATESTPTAPATAANPTDGPVSVIRAALVRCDALRAKRDATLERERRTEAKAAELRAELAQLVESEEARVRRATADRAAVLVDGKQAEAEPSNEARIAELRTDLNILNLELATRDTELDSQADAEEAAYVEALSALQEHLVACYHEAASRLVTETVVPLLALQRELKRRGGSAVRSELITRNLELPFYQGGRRDYLYDVRGPRLHLMGEEAVERFSPLAYDTLLIRLLNQLADQE